MTRELCGKLLFSSTILVEVAVGEDQRSHQGPHVKRDADPAGGDLHPHRWPFAGYGLIVGVGAVPVGECHHDVQRGQEKHEVEERVAVGDSILLIVNSAAAAVAHFKAVRCGAVLDQSRFIAGEGQLVHLSVAGVADTGVQHTHQEQNQSHNALGIPPLNNTVLTGGAGAVESNDAQQAGVAFSVRLIAHSRPSQVHGV